ncbi:MAG: 23S rRNA (guanosine(2251)-2'-O)-methyltransferase RlmB [Betaproteobacteria bacterium]|nr:23S rRNA (guanosine(2251)-2'-O)-methyltransferase RlmB [Betaproteobacteria bacterium]NBT74574.1 23S rRNA (guanosine(2251)-2'-O)-methyltransferase RlmB [Betaproteobacteria bacterium]NCA16288.1 23S rRNA (guanosine(2251)-2'-O)-methyltransferase RlmB [Betaproteobacteria bacterium]
MQELLLLGFHAVRGRLKSAPKTIHQLWMDETRKDARLKALAAECEVLGLPVRLVSSEQLDQMSKGERHQGVIARAERPALAADLHDLLASLPDAPADVLLLLLDGVTDPHNLGAILRTADASAVAGVLAPKDRSAPLNEVAARVSSGGSDWVPYIQVTNLSRAIEALQDEGFHVVGLDGDATASLYDVSLRGRIALVLGAEGEGMRRLTKEHCDTLARLPMMGEVESLNVSVACGVACFEVLRQRR